MSTVGVVGAGRMGTPIIGHLVRAGHDVAVYDVAHTRRAAVEDLGASWSATPAELAARSEFLLVCVGYDREVVEVTAGPGGLLSAAPAGSTIAVLSTVLPETVSELAERGARHAVEVIDTTVCRGSWYADEGTLLSFVGGSEELFARWKPVISAYSSDIIHSGAVGTAQVCKAANNLILWACLIADHEAFALAQRYGVDIDVLRQALLISSATNGPLTEWGRQTMAWAEDDMVIVGQMANKLGLGLPQAGLNREICRSLKPRRYDVAAYGL